MNQREIKFRAWIPDHKRMCEVWSLDTRLGLVETQDWKLSYKDGAVDIVPMQFTGLKDKNGREIYEGDLLHIEPIEKTAGWREWSTNEHRPIVYDGAAFRFDGMNLAEMLGWGGYPSHINCEVIGNIYENPDLLVK